MITVHEVISKHIQTLIEFAGDNTRKRSFFYLFLSYYYFFFSNEIPEVTIEF